MFGYKRIAELCAKNKPAITVFLDCISRTLKVVVIATYLSYSHAHPLDIN